ncbi:hypothetical protein ACET3Z_001181 [Daucus carota]
MKSVLGLPMGSESIEQGDNEERLSLWGIQVKDSEIASAEDRQGTIAAENKSLDAMDESGSKGNRDGDNISDEALVVEDSLTLHDECLNDGWEEWVNPTQEHNLNDADFAQPSQPTVCNATKKDGTDKTADEDKQGEKSNVAREECKNLGETTELLTMTQYMQAVQMKSTEKVVEKGNFAETNEEQGQILETPKIDVTKKKELKTKFGYFFKLFRETSPLSKRLFTRVEAEKDTTKTMH